jgi:hypothetical protein
MDGSTHAPPDRSPPPQTLRSLLASSPPHTFALKRAWAPLIRALRAARRAGAEVSITSRGELDRALDAAPPEGPDRAAKLEALKEELAALVGGAADEGCAARVDAAIAALLPAPASAPVSLEIAGWPPGLDAAGRRRLLGGDPAGAWDPVDAELAARRLHGLVTAGRALDVTPRWPPGRAAPPIPRERRHRPRRGRAAPWLAVDEQGRWSLTPRHIAEAQASLAAGRPVIDACCGCGGNAVAFALAGCQVTAIELDPARLALAKQNARHHRVGGRLRLLRGDALALVPGLLAETPGAVLFLDPPWGGPGEPDLTFEALLPGWDLAALAAERVLIKAPRAFDVATLPAGLRWEVRCHFGADGADDADVIKLLTLIGRR